jgi:mono/diheme cytochrome c family protein
LSLLTGAALVTAAGLSVFAQGSAPAPAPAAGRGAGPAPAMAGRESPAGQTADFSPRTPYLPRTPADEAKGFILPTGYRMELVASDPDVISPGVIVFDGDGRMYVSELIGYMQDVDATNEHGPISRISRWESTKHDGHYDKHTVFVDHLVAPRMILPMLDGSILTSETDSDDVVQWTDTNGDGVADQRKVVFTGIGQSGDANIEHQKAGLVWNMDNWIYTTYNAFRIRWTPSGFLREPTGPNGGQWGLATDDDGKPWFVDAGGERGPMNFQYPIEYGAFTPCPAAGRGRGFGARGAAPAQPEAPDPNCPPGMENGFEKDFAVVWPAPGIGDMQGGLNRTRMPARNLNHFTAATGPAIVRGDRLPADMKGDLLFTEPVGRLIRRAKIVNIEGLTELQNVYPGSEFLTSEDQLFRPVNIANAPDGTVYVADMYHGIIQEREWSGPGTYLRAKIEQYQLDKVAHYGRIWRLRYDGRPAVAETPTNPGQPAIPAIDLDLTPARMYEETPAQLVAHLTHPNGWWRDTAQRILILKQDKSVVPALEQMARSSDNLVARFHALWTLEGLGALDAGLVRQEMKDSNPRMRIQAIRASETLYKAGDKSFADDYRAMTKDADTDVDIQAMLTANLFKLSDADDLIKATMAANHAKGVQLIGAHLLEPPANNAFGGGRGAALSAEDRQLLEQGSQVFNAVCSSCHAPDGRGQPLAGAAPGVTMAPPLAGSPRVQGHKDYVIHVLLDGLTGPVNDKTYAEVMVPMGANTDQWVAGIASYVRTNLGNSAGMVTPADVARVRAADASRKTPWTVAEIEARLPRPLSPDGWKLTASAGQDAVDGALNLRGWISGTPQAPGMWFQVELPQAATVTEVQFDSPAARVRGQAPGGARGAAAARGGRGAARGGARGRAGGGFQVTTIPQYPRGYRIETSMDGKTWSKPVAEGQGDGTRTDVSFAPAHAKYIRITQTGTADDSANWAISNLRIYEAPAAK